MYCIYKTTNQINGKYYIGVTNGNNKWYKGSGTALKQAIKKYGGENFKTEVLETFETECEAYTREKQLVSEALVNERECYNLKTGGRGGAGQKKTDTHKKHIAENRKGGKPLVNVERTLEIYNLHGLKEGANIENVSYQAFKARVLLAKKRLTKN